MGGTRKATRTYSIHFMLEIGLRPYAFRYLAGVMLYRHGLERLWESAVADSVLRFGTNSYSNSSITFSGFDPRRSGRPQVPAQHDGKTRILPVRAKPYPNC